MFHGLIEIERSIDVIEINQFHIVRTRWNSFAFKKQKNHKKTNAFNERIILKWSRNNSLRRSFTKVFNDEKRISDCSRSKCHANKNKREKKLSCGMSLSNYFLSFRTSLRCRRVIIAAQFIGRGKTYTKDEVTQWIVLSAQISQWIRSNFFDKSLPRVLRLTQTTRTENFT